ncbi:hypothetical protein HispidOSU_021016, partial [Sigmodon hispidus]
WHPGRDDPCSVRTEDLVTERLTVQDLELAGHQPAAPSLSSQGWRCAPGLGRGHRQRSLSSLPWSTTRVLHSERMLLSLQPSRAGDTLHNPAHPMTQELPALMAALARAWLPSASSSFPLLAGAFISSLASATDYCLPVFVSQASFFLPPFPSLVGHCGQQIHPAFSYPRPCTPLSPTAPLRRSLNNQQPGRTADCAKLAQRLPPLAQETTSAPKQQPATRPALSPVLSTGRHR